MKSDDFWDYSQQLDLEAFSAPTLYDILSTQARDVTQGLGKQKEEVSKAFIIIITSSDAKWKQVVTMRELTRSYYNKLGFFLKLNILKTNQLKVHDVFPNWLHSVKIWRHTVRG